MTLRRLSIGSSKSRLRVDLQMSREVGNNEQQIPEFFDQLFMRKLIPGFNQFP